MRAREAYLLLSLVSTCSGSNKDSEAETSSSATLEVSSETLAALEQSEKVLNQFIADANAGTPEYEAFIAELESRLDDAVADTLVDYLESFLYVSRPWKSRYFNEQELPR